MTKANDCQTNNNPIKQVLKLGQKVRLYCAAVDDIALRKGSTLLVLSVMLFQFHNTKGGRCDPSEETIGLKCGLSERQVRRCIKILMKQEWVTIKQRRYNDSNLYDFAWNKVPNEDISGQSMRTFQVVNEDISGYQTGHIGSVNEDTGVRLTQEYNTGSRTQEKNSLSEREVLLIDSPNEQNNQVKLPNLHKKPQFPVFGINEARGDLRFIKPDKIPAMRKWLLSLGLPSNKVKQMSFPEMIEYYNDETNALIKSHHKLAAAPAVAVPSAAPAAVSPAIAGLLAELAKVGLIFHEQMTYIRSCLNNKKYNPRMSDCYKCLKYGEDGTKLLKPTFDDLRCFATLLNADSGHLEEFAATMPELALVYHEKQLYPALQWEKLLQQIIYDLEWAKEMIDKHTSQVNNDEDILQAFKEL